MIEICKEAGVTVVNPVAEFRQAANSDRPSDYFELDGHFNSNGQRRLGESVARSLWPTTE